VTAIDVEMVEVRSTPPSQGGPRCLVSLGTWYAGSPIWRVAGHQVPRAERHGAKAVFVSIVV
jgi:hypothetical protein